VRGRYSRRYSMCGEYMGMSVYQSIVCEIQHYASAVE